jgi:cell division transport system permease protein
MLGWIGTMILNTRKISNYVKENIGFTIFLKETVKEADIFRLQKNLDATRYIKSTEYITKDQATKQFQQELGEDFVNFLGYSPLLSSIEAKLYADYANQDSLAMIEKELLKYDQVKEVYYQKSVVHLINEYAPKISLTILVFCGLLFIIAISLINNTIRLSIYAKRFLINTMQLVGATRSFIRKPFLLKSILHGVYGASIAISITLPSLYWADKQLKDIVTLTELNSVLILCFLQIFIGIVINLISTWFSVNKFLRLRTDDLYY